MATSNTLQGRLPQRLPGAVAQNLEKMGEGWLPPPFYDVTQNYLGEGRALPPRGHLLSYGVRIGNGSAFVQADESPALLLARIR